MMNEQVAGGMDEPVVFSEELALDTPELRGIFSNSASHSYHYDGPQLRVFSSHGESLSQYDFSKGCNGSTSETPPSILCVSQFNKANLLIGMEESNGSGILHLFNVTLSKILRSFVIPFGVTSLETIHEDSDCNDIPYLCQELQNLSGLVACGTKQGNIYLIDMILDQEVTQVQPLQLQCYDLSGGHVIDRLQLLTEQDKVTAYSLACTDNPEYFCYQSAGLQILHYAHLEDVFISSLRFIPQLGTLCVGYNLGSYQLWRLDPLTLDYSSPVDAQALPISNFSYQEPENDPRSFCYLWVARCSGVCSASDLSDSMMEYIAGTTASISLYQLAYDMKSYTDDGNVLFKDLMQVGCALEHQLAPEEDVITSWVVSLQTLSNVKSTRCLEEDSQLDVMPVDTNMTAVSWRVRYSDDSFTSHFAVFDINRWYHAQMPKRIRWYEGWCSYFSQYSFDDDIVGDKQCLDLYINTGTIACYRCPRLRKLERFQYPASLSFEVKLLLSDGVLTLQYNGLQRQALIDVVNTGHEAITEPNNAFQLLLSTGLITNNTDDMVKQRKEILTTLLLHTHTEYITHCMWEASKSKHGEDDSGVNIRFIFEWIWERLETVIYTFDRSCVPLYDWSGLPADSLCKQSLLSSITQTKNIISILQHISLLIKRISHIKLEGINVEERLAISHTRLLYMRLVWWCVNRGLLPEVTEDDTSSICFSYPSVTLKRSYNNRQSQLLMTKSIKTPELMIDTVARELGGDLSKLIEDEGGCGVYPPPNLKALMDVFLLRTCSMSAKLMYFVYTVLDLMALVDQAVNDCLSSHLSGLISSVLHSDSQSSNISTLVLAMWSLDHMEFQDVMVSLRQPEVMYYMTDNLAECIISTLLSHDQLSTALQAVTILSTYRVISPDILITTYLANKMVFSAVEVCRITETPLPMFRRILNTLKTRVQVSEVLCLPLTDEEMMCVSEYLTDQGDLDKLVIHLLQIGEIASAVLLNKKLNTQPLWRGNQKAKERAMTRDQLVRWQLSLLPPIQKKLLEDPNYLQMKRVKITRPKDVRAGNKSFFSMSGEKRPLAAVEIAQVIMDSSVGQAEGSDYKPFLQSLTPSVNKTTNRRTATMSALKYKVKSVTGLYDSPGLRTVSKRSIKSSDEAPQAKSAKQSSPLTAGTGDVRSILQTPSIRRKSPRGHYNNPAPTATPHSILKIRKPHIKPSPSNIAQSPNLRFNLSASEKLVDSFGASASRSVSRVKFSEVQHQLSDSSLITSPPGQIAASAAADEDEDSIPASPPKVILFDDEEMTELHPPTTQDAVDAYAADPRYDEEVSDSSDIEFNFDAPLQRVFTAGRSNSSKLNTSVDAGGTNTDLCADETEEEDSFASVSSELSPPKSTQAVNTSATIICHQTEGDNLLRVTESPDEPTSHIQVGMDMTAAVHSNTSSEERHAKQTRNCLSTAMNITLAATSTSTSTYEREVRHTVITTQHHSTNSMDMTLKPPITSSSASSLSDRSNDGVDDMFTPERPITQTASITKHSPQKESPRSVKQTSDSPPNRTVSTPSPRKTPLITPPKASPHKTSLSPPKAMSLSSLSPAESLKSLSNLDEEAQLSGLQLRQVREAEMNNKQEFAFSPVTIAAGSLLAPLTQTSGEKFIFTQPTDAERKATKFAFTSPHTLEKSKSSAEPSKPPKPCIMKSHNTTPSSTTASTATGGQQLVDFYFSPAAPAADPGEQHMSNQQAAFSFTPPEPAVATQRSTSNRMSNKPARPIKITLPTSKNKSTERVKPAQSGSNEEDLPSGMSTRSSKPIRPFKITLPDTYVTRITTKQKTSKSSQSSELVIKEQKENAPDAVELSKPTVCTTSSTVEPTTSAVEPTISTVESTTSTVKPTSSTVKPTTSTVEPTTPTVESTATTEQTVRRSRRNRKPSDSTADGLNDSILAGNVPTTRGQRTIRSKLEQQSAEVATKAPSTPTRRGRPRKTSQSSQSEAGDVPVVISQPNELHAISEDISEVPSQSTRRGRPRKTSGSSQSEAGEVHRGSSVGRTEELHVISEQFSEAKQQNPTTIQALRTRRMSTSSNPPAAVGDSEPVTPRRSTRAKAPSLLSGPADAELELPTTPTRKGRSRKNSQSTTKQSASKARGNNTDTTTVSSSEIVGDVIQSKSVEPKKLAGRRRTRLRSADKQHTGSTLVELRLETTGTDISPSKQSPTKLSMRITSPKKSQSARKADETKIRSVTRSTRTSVKKPQLSPIISPPDGNTPAASRGPTTRARRKLQ